MNPKDYPSLYCVGPLIYIFCGVFLVILVGLSSLIFIAFMVRALKMGRSHIGDDQPWKGDLDFRLGPRSQWCFLGVSVYQDVHSLKPI